MHRSKGSRNLISKGHAVFCMDWRLNISVGRIVVDELTPPLAHPSGSHQPILWRDLSSLIDALNFRLNSTHYLLPAARPYRPFSWFDLAAMRSSFIVTIR